MVNHTRAYGLYEEPFSNLMLVLLSIVVGANSLMLVLSVIAVAYIGAEKDEVSYLGVGKGPAMLYVLLCRLSFQTSLLNFSQRQCPLLDRRSDCDMRHIIPGLAYAAETDAAATTACHLRCYLRCLMVYDDGAMAPLHFSNQHSLGRPVQLLPVLSIEYHGSQ